MSWIVTGMVGVSVLSSMAGEADQNAAMVDKAKAFGIRKAGIQASKDQALDGVVANARQLQEAKAYQGIDIEKSSDMAEAQAKVNAAAAGVSGTSVDLTIAQADVNAANATNQVERKNKQDREQLKLNFVNTIINAETQTGTLDTSTRDQTGKHILAGVTGFVGAHAGGN